MTDLKEIAGKLTGEFPGYHFLLFRGLWGKYIAVEIRDKIPFTIWVDRNSGHKVLLDEVNFRRSDLLKRLFKSQSLHWSKYRKRLWRRDYHTIMHEELTIKLPERAWIRDRLEFSLKKMHLTPKQV